MSAARAESVPDLTLALVTLMLVSVGLVLIYSTSAILALGQYHDSYHFIERQALFLVLGMALALYLTRVSAEALKRAAGPAMGLALAGLVLVLVPHVGERIGGARRWIRLGPLALQASEMAKLALVFFLAERLSRGAGRDLEGRDWRSGLGAVLGVVGLGCVLALAEPDFGSMVVFAALGWVMLYCSGAPLWFLAAPLAAGLPAAALLILHSPYRLKRLEVFLHPWKDPQGAGFQIVHSMMAFGCGGLFGVGLGQGKQKLYYLPEPHTDFIFSTAGEEFGFVGCVLILGLFAVLLWRGFVVALRARDPFLKLLSVGITSLLGLQVVINLFVVLGLAPTKGAALPFLSYGGSSLLMNLAAVGVLLNVSRQPGTA